MMPVSLSSTTFSSLPSVFMGGLSSLCFEDMDMNSKSSSRTSTLAFDVCFLNITTAKGIARNRDNAPTTMKRMMKASRVADPAVLGSLDEEEDELVRSSGDEATDSTSVTDAKEDVTAVANSELLKLISTLLENSLLDENVVEERETRTKNSTVQE